MRDELAAIVLAHVMKWDPDQLAQFGACLQDLARYKYDEYEGFGPGEKFVESLAAWLWPLKPAQRADAIQFVMTSLVFVSRLELDRVIGILFVEMVFYMGKVAGVPLAAAKTHDCRYIVKSIG